MSLPDLAAVLWRQRDLLERLVYRLECEQLLLAAGRTRFVGTATAEVETVLAELRVLEMQRCGAADRVAAEAGLAPGASLEELAGAVQPPWTGVLVEHRDALLVLTRELATLAETNRNLVTAGLKAVEATLAGLGTGEGPSPVGYDARGRSGLVHGAGPLVVDRSL
jgi:FlgN protein